MAKRYLLSGFAVEDNDWLTPREAAQIAGVLADTLSNMARRGAILPRDVGWTPGSQRRFRAGAMIALREEAGK